jgi:hypothetical protein
MRISRETVEFILAYFYDKGRLFAGMARAREEIEVYVEDGLRVTGYFAGVCPAIFEIPDNDVLIDAFVQTGIGSQSDYQLLSFVVAGPDIHLTALSRAIVIMHLSYPLNFIENIPIYGRTYKGVNGQLGIGEPLYIAQVAIQTMNGVLESGGVHIGVLVDMQECIGRFRNKSLFNGVIPGVEGFVMLFDYE